MVVASPVAERLGCALQPVFVAKIRHPLQSEFAIGAVDEDGEVHFSVRDVALLSPQVLEGVVESAEFLVERQKRVYGRGPTQYEQADRTVVLIDDGLATGESCRAALAFIRSKKPASLILAVPCASVSGVAKVKHFCDRLITLIPADSDFYAVGQYYEDFAQVETDEVSRILNQFRPMREAG